jgi:heptaprenylglyceryl phosphate synthase
MIPIKYRVWDKDHKQLIYSTDDNYIFLVNPNGTVSVFDNKEHIFRKLNTDPPEWFTGLTDKNNQDIYEGDCIDHCAATGYVIFEDGMFALNTSANVQFGKHKQPLCYLDITECEIIGTIHDSQEDNN